ncbi:MAG: TrkH family potassium uptake protein [Gammaproteobacteria bacterium]|nr:TrkH family potassium uptake protein [Gammaproteobacteria bacterium]MCW8992384.1 TrkH family potassium uptake protein [Gammaproteobacteria bacterium]
MSEGIQTLRHAVRPTVLAKYLGQLALVLAMLSLVPLAASLFFAEYGISLRYLLVIPGLLLLFFLSLKLPTPAQLQQNEALAIVALAFLLSPLISSFTMMAGGLGWGEALFESISAITTTGLSTLDDLQERSHTFLFTRAWLQWYGGLGIVVLSLALMAGYQATSRRLAEPPAGEGLATTTRTYARHILGVYVALTLLGIALLSSLGMTLFDAVSHALAAVSTGGFSPHNESLGYFDAPAKTTGVVLIGLAGAVPLHLYYRFRQRGLTTTLRDPELRALLLLTLLVCGALGLSLYQHGMSGEDALFHGLIQGVSAQSTSGFSSLDIAALDDGSKLTLIISMFLGGGLGSTAGGIKLLRLLILLRLIQLLLQRSALPSHAVTQPRLSGRPLEEGDIQAALLLILMFIVIIVLSWLIFLAYGYAPIDALFEVVSASATVGLSSGITGSALEPELQALLCFDMLLGRLEIIALLVVLYPPTWLGKRMEST